MQQYGAGGVYLQVLNSIHGDIPMARVKTQDRRKGGSNRGLTTWGSTANMTSISILWSLLSLLKNRFVYSIHGGVRGVDGVSAPLLLCHSGLRKPCRMATQYGEFFNHGNFARPP
ncbi:hypothetical protein DFH06DRAFT_1132632 [Mycena polygramma]|nr:hypothetical protein DFH06DRAFT_1132632 [Mycena polygramma]